MRDEPGPWAVRSTTGTQSSEDSINPEGQGMLARYQRFGGSVVLGKIDACCRMALKVVMVIIRSPIAHVWDNAEVSQNGSNPA